jgi:hypothetical protein
MSGGVGKLMGFQKCLHFSDFFYVLAVGNLDAGIVTSRLILFITSVTNLTKSMQRFCPLYWKYKYLKILLRNILRFEHFKNYFRRVHTFGKTVSIQIGKHKQQ